MQASQTKSRYNQYGSQPGSKRHDIQRFSVDWTVFCCHRRQAISHPGVSKFLNKSFKNKIVTQGVACLEREDLEQRGVVVGAWNPWLLFLDGSSWDFHCFFSVLTCLHSEIMARWLRQFLFCWFKHAIYNPCLFKHAIALVFVGNQQLILCRIFVIPWIQMSLFAASRTFGRVARIAGARNFNRSISTTGKHLKLGYNKIDLSVRVVATERDCCHVHI